jgi:Right handed beta helix region
MSSFKNCLFALVVAATATVSGQQVFACIPSGSTDVQINAALHSTGLASLCPNTVYKLYNKITFTAADQEISTEGYPTDGSRATLQVMGASLSTAISGVGYSGIRILNIAVNGNRPGLGYMAAPPSGLGTALIEIGGYSSGQLVQEVHAYEPRGWSTLHIYEGNVAKNQNCTGAQILNNQIGPAGEPSDSQWADGISLGCKTSLVQGNVVTDATDGGIVVFGAPGSLIQYNTIEEPTRVLLGGINMVDYAPYNGDYNGTRVMFNTINSGSGSGYIKVGIGMGAHVWSAFSPPAAGPNYGGTVTYNTFEGNGFGYATVENYAINFNVANNALSSGPIFDGLMNNCSGSNADPQAFTLGTVADGVCLIPQFNFRLGGFVSYTNQEINMGELMFGVMQSDGNFVIYGAPGKALWATGTAGTNCSAGCLAQFQTDGNFVLYQSINGQWHPFWSTGTYNRGAIQIRFAPVSPFLEITSATGVLWKAT